MSITIHLIKPAKNTVITYQATLLERSDTHMLVHAQWERPYLDTGYVVFEPGDNLYEYFYCNRWYNIYQLHTAEGVLKGWYCNITRPAVLQDDTIESEDLELDVFVSPDRSTFLVLDEDEYAARGLATSDPAAHHAARAALDELRQMVERGEQPFHTSDR
jgi:hypothetical protein